MSDLTLAGASSSDRDRNELGIGGAERLERRLFIALVGGVLLGASWIAGMLGMHEQIARLPAAIGALILVVPLLGGAWEEIRRGSPSSNALAALAVLAALASQNFLAAGFLAFFLWIANLVLSRTAWGAQRAIRDLVDLTPDDARVVETEYDGESLDSGETE